ncbi:MAG: protein translocase subunit SecD [Alphaproteobacteria bacterium]|nr:protein translocase subunit SecD [Alphaproteobacteria bacterium]
MFGYPKWRAWTIIVVSAISLFFSIPNFMSEEYYKTNVPKSMQSWWRPMSLGLDLKGGSSLLLEVQMDALVNERMSSLADAARSVLREKQITFLPPRTENGVLTIKVISSSELLNAKTLINKLEPGLDIEIQDNDLKITYSDMALTKLQTEAISQSIEIVRKRIDELGTKEPSIQQQGSNRIQVQLPGVQNPSEVKALLGKTAKMTFHLVDEKTTVADAQRGKIPSDSMLINSDDTGTIVIKRQIIVGGDQLESAKADFGEGAEPVVAFAFKSLGAKKFAQVTRENVGKRLAIVLDGQVISAPVINGPIPGRGIISGSFTVESASELALMLRSGALPAPLIVVDERFVGADLGTDSIQSGTIACLIGMGLVFAFMLIVYGWFGMFANLALVINVFLLLSVLSLLGATLTLPGLAGIALTIGMAVDSNVLIYARMKDEARLGRSPIQVINAGFENSFTAIFDSQITTLFAAMVLFFMGSGPIRGFSVTLGVGVLTSLFTAVMITKFLIMIWYTLTKPKTIKI